MPLLNINALIKKLRIAQGMTQEKLAEGICSRITISRIERGEHRPDWFILQNVLQRLGVKPENLNSDIIDLISEEDAYVVKQRSKLQQYLVALDMKNLKSLLDKLESDERFAKSAVENSGRGYQTYLRYKAALHMYEPYLDISASLKYITECIKLNRPDFDIDKISQYFLSPEELQLINLMAVAYNASEETTKAIEILLKLKDSYEEQYMVNVFDNRQYRLLLLNIAGALNDAGRHEECLKASEEGLECALIHSEMISCLIYFRQKAISLMKLGREEEGREEGQKFLMLAYVMGKHAAVSFEDAKKECEKIFGSKIELIPKWN
ncbi:MAG: helix-turn-helix domain-containing protein [Firmicutes bacterium]|nr:helix-turn-helix domain-containing protein [Bacillota bacterium]